MRYRQATFDIDLVHSTMCHDFLDHVSRKSVADDIYACHGDVISA